MTKFDRMLEILLSQYDCVKTLASHMSGKDMLSLGATNRRYWQAIFKNLSVLTKNASFGVKCDGSGVDRWGGRQVQIHQHSPNFRCLDQVYKVSHAKPCVKCGTPVCNVCRFHLNRSVEYPWSEAPGWRFEDEQLLEENQRPEWRTVGYHHINRVYDNETLAYNIIADSVRVYCKQHLPAYKRGLQRILHPNRLPGPLCRCNELDVFVGDWLCIRCFDNQSMEAEDRKKNRCCERYCNRMADMTWKQCVLCSKLKEPYQPKGYNAVYRRD